MVRFTGSGVRVGRISRSGLGCRGTNGSVEACEGACGSGVGFNGCFRGRFDCGLGGLAVTFRLNSFNGSQRSISPLTSALRFSSLLSSSRLLTALLSSLLSSI